MTISGRAVLEGCAVATVDAAGTEHSTGYIVIADGVIEAVGGGSAPDDIGPAERIDASGCVATPGLVNCHHHLYQWLTRGHAQEATLFEWLTALYPVWARLDADMEEPAAIAGLTTLALSGCSTSSDHHYVFPRGGEDLLDVAIEAAARVGLRFHACRGSMDLGKARGGLPPDEITEDIDHILSATEDAIDRYDDPAPASMLRIAVAPCSPFSATTDLMRASADLARSKGVRLHTHLAETADEEDFCRERFGVRPVEYLAELGWLGDDVWLAHCIHLSSAEVERLGSTATGVAHCPTSNARLGAGIAPVGDLLRARAPVGLGVDGAASNEAGELGAEMRSALLSARVRGGPAAMTAREVLKLATIGGARCLGRDRDLGSLEPGKQADIALWGLGDVGHAGIDDPVAALVFGPVPRAERLMVAGRAIVEAGRATTVDQDAAAANLDKASRRLRELSEAG